MSICNLDHFAESYWQDRKFVLISGCFDPLHEGHLSFFSFARQYGPIVCAVEPSTAVARKRSPFLPDQTRVQVLNACSWIEHVHLNLHGVAAVIRALKPSHYVVGADWEDCLPPETMQACREVGTAIVYHYVRVQSSSALLGDYERRRNADKLAQLEAFCRNQTPAEKPWEPVTDYSRETRRAIEAPQADIIADVFKGCSVLDHGCGFGYLVDLLRERGMDARGWDPHYRPDFDTQVMDGHDVVICREVLEHLPIQELVSAVRIVIFLASKYVYVTTRFTNKPHLLDVDGSDDLDPTHITLLSQDFLRTLFVLEGCTRRADLEQRLDWQKKGRVLVYEVPA